jgi:trigger factor
VRIPGFRPGKAPARILEQRLGRGVVLEEVVNEAVPAKYSEALTEAEVQPLGQPDFEVTSNIAELGEDEPLAFTAEVDIRPEITVPDYSDISVSVDAAEVTDSDVDDQMQSLRTRFGTLTGVDRPAQNGDFVVMDLSATVDGEEIEDAKTTGMSHEVGSGQLVEGVDEALVGMSAGDDKTFTAKLFYGEHADREAEVALSVSQVKERTLPEADDEFAQLASEFDTLDELKADMRERLARVKRMEQGSQARDKVLDEVLERADVPLPEVVVQAEVDNRLHQAIHQFDHDEDGFAQYLES